VDGIRSRQAREKIPLVRIRNRKSFPDAAFGLSRPGIPLFVCLETVVKIMKKSALMIVDAHAMAYRAYFALQGQNLTNALTGQPTSAIYGFFRMLFRALLDHKPGLTAVAWDSPGKSFRGRVYRDYKATRKPMPDDLRFQIDEIKEILSRCGFANLEVPEYEADDVIGTLAARFGKKGEVIILSSDKDCYQLLNKNVTMLRSAKGVTDFTVINPEWVKTELGVEVKEITDYMGLVGDSSDNIPGAKGIGPKSAAQLIGEYHSIENIYKNIAKVSSKSVREKLESSKENVILSKQLATIHLDVAPILELDEKTIITPNFLTVDIAGLFRKEGYTGIYAELLKNIPEESKSRGVQGELFASPAKGSKAPADSKYELISDVKSLEKLAEKLADAQELAVDTETDSQQPMLARLAGISICLKPGKAWYIALPPADSPFREEGMRVEEALPHLKKILEKTKARIVGQNIKYDFIVLKRHGILLKNLSFDTMIASYLCNPNVRRHSLDDMALDYLGHNTIKYDDIVGSGRNRTTMDKISPASIRDYACEDADLTLRLAEILKGELKKRGLEKVNENIEMALIEPLAEMEETGVAIDIPYFKKLSDDYEKRLQGLETEIFKAAGVSFNISSTKELQHILFEKMMLPRGKKTKTGYSTDQSVLEDLRGSHSIIDNLLEHRKYSKLKSTYVDALPEIVNPVTGRLHTSFNQTIAATGRLSSVEPNLQNIPIREDTGRAIRRGFIPEKGSELLSLDYSQIELRIMAHYSEDPALMEAFIEDSVDVHARTASSIFGVKEKEVTPDMRAKAKVVNFSIIYGVTEYGLGQSLNVDRHEARAYIDRFFEKYPCVRKYMDSTVKFAEKTGYVETLSGRKRQIEDIKSSNRFRREGAYRTAINTPIQGTSADIIKIAMIRIHHDIAKKKLKSRMILQVHDELLFDVIPSEKKEVLEIAKGHMENAMELRIPLKVDYGFGKNWDEAH